jgi:signal transduction histidine kinase
MLIQLAGDISRLACGVWGHKTLLQAWLLASTAASLIAAPGLSDQAPASLTPANTAPLTNVAQILALSPEQAGADLPVRIEGVITCYDHLRVLFVQDKTAGIFVYHTGARLPLRPGEYVRVAGVAIPGRFSPVINLPVIEPLETGPAIKPQPVLLPQIQSGNLDAQWVELSGVVREQRIFDNRLLLELVDPPHRIKVWIPNYEGYERLALPGSLVGIRGVAGSCFGDSGQLTEFQVFANTTADITVLRPAPPDPFSTPLRQVRDLKTYAVRNAGSTYVRIRGSVTLTCSPHTVFLQDSTGSAEVSIQSSLSDLTPGTVVEVAGYPGPILEPPLLEDALVRKLNTRTKVQPARIAPEDLALSRHDNELIETEVKFLGLANTSSNSLALAAQGGGRFFTALLAAPDPQGSLALLEPGSRVRLTGVCRSQAAPGVAPAVSLLLRSLADVKLISPPNPARKLGANALAVAAIPTTVGLVAALFFIQYQRRKTERVLLLQAALQSEMRQGEQQLRRSMEERERIGRDLHDDIIQSIYAVGLSLEDCRRSLRQTPEQVETRLAGAIQTLNNSIRSVRGFIAGLEPKVLNGREFKTALKSLVLTSDEGPTQIHFEVDPAAANSLSPTQATQLFHIAKEAISNSLRHARATLVTASLRLITAGIRLEIRDNGVGFDPGAAGKAGQGLRNAGTRAREIAGELQIVSSPGQGCRIIVTVPQRAADEPG